MPTSDEKLARQAANERGLRLGKLYTEIAENARCRCESEHKETSPDCPKAAWQQAARMAIQMATE